jgi:hypothetical protein
MILRVLLPNNRDLDHTVPCLLLGALLNSTQKRQAVLTAIAVSVTPIELLSPLSQVEQQLANSRVCLTTAQAKLAVLGTWLPGPHHSAAASYKDPHGSEKNIWLVLQGSQCLQQALGCSSWHSQRWTAPTCNFQQCILPPGTESVQVPGTATIRIGSAPPPTKCGAPSKTYCTPVAATPVCICVSVHAVVPVQRPSATAKMHPCSAAAATTSSAAAMDEQRAR